MTRKSLYQPKAVSYLTFISVKDENRDRSGADRSGCARCGRCHGTRTHTKISYLIRTILFQIFKALHIAYQQALSNPFLRLYASPEATGDATALLSSAGDRWKGLKRRVDDIGRVVGANAGTDE